MTGRARRPWRLLLAGGGTGGHIYPALAVARRAAERFPPVEVLYVGGRGGLEEGIVPREGLPLVTLPVRGLVRRRPAEVLRGLGLLGAAGYHALRAVRRFRPDVAVATGGYAAGPVGAAAWLLGVPLVVQEQNAVPGVTNRLLSLLAAGVAVPFAEAAAAFPPRARGRIWVIGNPVRPGLADIPREAARRRLGLPAAGPVVLLIAGSRGSAVFVRLFHEWLRSWRGPGALLFVTGQAHYAAARAGLPGGEAPPGVFLVPYLHEAGDGYAAADLVVARAGAMTLADISAVGRPAVLVPSLHVTHHHQEANAAVYAKAGAAVVLPEAGLTGERLGAVVAELLGDPERLRAMAEASRRLDRPRALDELVERVHRLAVGG